VESPQRSDEREDRYQRLAENDYQLPLFETPISNKQVAINLLSQIPSRVQAAAILRIEVPCDREYQIIKRPGIAGDFKTPTASPMKRPRRFTITLHPFKSSSRIFSFTTPHEFAVAVDRSCHQFIRGHGTSKEPIVGSLEVGSDDLATESQAALDRIAESD
jgi:hypothetical protein